jgi:rhodanese-related sulfurtransferase
MFNLDPYLLLPLALVLFLMALPILSRKIHGPVTYILANQLLQRLKSGEELTLIDLRSKKQFENRHIEGSVNISAREVEQKLGREAASPDIIEQAMVIICASDLHSVKLAAKLGKKGFSGVMVLKGGLYKWKRDHQSAMAAISASQKGA